MQRPKKFIQGKFFRKNNSSGSKIPQPPHNFSNGPFLRTPDQIEITKVFW